MAQSPENSPSDDSPPSSSSDDLSPPPKKKSDRGGDGDGDRSPPAGEVSDGDSSPPPPPQQLPPSDKNSSADSDKSNAFFPPDFRNDNGDRDKNKSKPSKNSSRENGGGNKHDARTPSISADDSPPPNNSYSNDTAVIAGVLVGVGILIIVVVAITVCCVKRKKKKQQHMPSYNKYDTKANQGQYNPNWYNSGQPSNTGSSGAMPPQGGWQMPPPPPHMMSSDMSGAYSSGPMGPPVPPPHPGLSLGGFSKSTFTYDELAAATQGFSQANLLGQGGFGFVHKGVLPNGKEVAVKSLKSGSGQGEREFQAEVEIISRVHHRHLVSLVGYCIAGGQRMLVYEFVSNGTLEFHLHGKGRPVMDFETRHKIALGSAKGLAYIHEDCNHRIIHRDIKTANILIDDAFEAKVADFGLAKLSSDTNQTHVSTRVMGTFGYLAPEYAASGKLTDKSDVFSYGVMLLELITGKRPIDPSAEEDSLVDWARPQLMRVLDEGRFEGLVDPRLENRFNTQEMTRMVACAAATIRHSAKRRPKMSQIVRALEGDMSLDALNGEGVKPGQSTYFGAGGTGSGEYDANSYKQDMKKFMMTLNEDEYTSSEYGSSNEYGRPGSGFTSTGGTSGMHGTKN